MNRNETNMAEFAVKGALTRLALFFDGAEGKFSGREVATILLQTWQGYENAKCKRQTAKLPAVGGFDTRVSEAAENQLCRGDR